MPEYDAGIKLASTQLQKTWLELRGTVKENDVPAKKRVAIIDRRLWITKAIRMSNPDDGGLWRWRIDPSCYPGDAKNYRFLAIALDDSQTYNAEVYDYLTPVEVLTTLLI